MRRLVVFFVLMGLFGQERGARALDVGQKAPAFSLRDLNGKVYTLDSFKKRIFAIWYEGPSSVTQNSWLKKAFLRALARGRINQANYGSIGIANFMESAVPNAVIRIMARREMRMRPQQVVLVDPDGRMQRLYGFRNGRANIFVLDQNRRLVWKSSGPLTRKRGMQFLRFIIRLSR